MVPILVALLEDRWLWTALGSSISNRGQPSASGDGHLGWLGSLLVSVSVSDLVVSIASPQDAAAMVEVIHSAFAARPPVDPPFVRQLRLRRPWPPACGVAAAPEWAAIRRVSIACQGMASQLSRGYRFIQTCSGMA